MHTALATRRQRSRFWPHLGQACWGARCSAFLMVALGGWPSAWAAKDVQAQAYRCQDNAGHVQYRQGPCPSGGQPLTQLADVRTPQQQRAATDMAQRDAMLARRMARDRRHLERLADDNHPRSLSPQPRSTAGDARPTDPHATVPAHRCLPPSCLATRVPKLPKQAPQGHPTPQPPQG